MASTEDREGLVDEKDVEGHGLTDAPSVDAPSIDQTDDDGDDVEAHGLIDRPAVDAPAVD